MYLWIWRRLPGNLAVKLAETLVLLLLIVALLMFVVFPWVEPHLPINQVTVPGQK
jgi:hypothetical protein